MPIHEPNTIWDLLAAFSTAGLSYLRAKLTRKK